MDILGASDPDYALNNFKKSKLLKYDLLKRVFSVIKARNPFLDLTHLTFHADLACIYTIKDSFIHTLFTTFPFNNL